MGNCISLDSCFQKNELKFDIESHKNESYFCPKKHVLVFNQGIVVCSECHKRKRCFICQKCSYYSCLSESCRFLTLERFKTAMNTKRSNASLPMPDSDRKVKD